jgi:protein-tyrosine-phosphatase
MGQSGTVEGDQLPVAGHRVLFVDVGNSTLGPMAEAFARHYGLEADSAGTMPAAEVSHGAVLALQERGLAVAPESRPKRIDFLRLADYERIICMDTGVTATSPDLHAHEHWDFADPVNLDFPVYRNVRDQVESRVKDLAREIREWSLPAEEEAPAHAGY